VGQAAMDEALDHARAGGGRPPAALADMATRLAGARLLTYWAAGMKDRGERCDLEAGMAKLAASEAAQELAVLGMRIAGEPAQFTTLAVERLYRDTPLMIIGEGTNEIQRLVIARQLLERGGAPPPGAGTDDERRLALAVHQMVDKEIVPNVPEYERADRWPEPMMSALADLGILGALVPPDLGGLGLGAAATMMLLQELARGWTTVAAIVTTHVVATDALARSAATDLRRGLPALTRGEVWAASAVSGDVGLARDGDGCVLSGRTGLVDNAARAGMFVVVARDADGPATAVVVPRTSARLRVHDAPATVGARGVGAGHLVLDGVRVERSAILGGEAAARIGGLARLGLAATAVGVAQAALEAALRYSRERETFGTAICQHQAIQLKLADMATAVTAARLLTAHGADRLDAVADDLPARMARLAATEAALTVTLEAMRIHGGYGYTTEFPAERYYRDAPRLALALGGNDVEREALARGLVP